MSIHPYAKFYDFWVGGFLDIPKRRLYLQPFPCLGVRIEFGGRGE